MKNSATIIITVQRGTFFETALSSKYWCNLYANFGMIEGGIVSQLQIRLLSWVLELSFFRTGVSAFKRHTHILILLIPVVIEGGSAAEACNLHILN